MPDQGSAITHSTACAISSPQQYTLENFKTYCHQQSIKFATELAKQDRPPKVVLRKFPLDALVKDIHKDLRDLVYPVRAVSQLYGRDKDTREKIPHPLFLVTLTRSSDIHKIYKQEYLLSYRVAVEPLDLLICCSASNVKNLDTHSKPALTIQAVSNVVQPI